MRNLNLKYKGEDIYYRTCVSPIGAIHMRYSFWTEFYIGFDNRTRPKYFLFGERITISTHKFAFLIGDLDIESSSHSKEEIKSKIEKKLLELERREEIENGIIV